MALYLVQHGQCHSKDQDPLKGLSDMGREQTALIAGVAADYKVPVSKVAHSGKLRAQQTAEIFADALKPQNGMQVMAGIAPLDDVASFAGSLALDEDLMLVGHLPFMEKMIAFLVTGQEQPSIFQMQNSGIVCIDADPRTGKSIIKWTLMPKIG
ncbi:MAG: phosphohistidine phosphatase SixA [Desulfobacteraceae bacterium]|jgi:phosphohistidine phosphatase